MYKFKINKMWRLLCLTVVMLGVFSLISTKTYADEILTSGDWKYTVSGTNALVVSYTGSDVNVDIPDKIDGYVVNVIGQEAFKGNTTMESVSIPDTVITIANSAFEGCSSLKGITLPKKLTTIGGRVFKGCTFSSISIPKYVNSCSYSDLYIDSPMESYHPKYDYGPLTGSAIVNISFEEGMQTIPSGVCYFSGVKSVAMPSTTKYIGSFAFAECKELSSIKFTDKLEAINEYAFRGCSALKGISFPQSLTSIYKGAFEGCTSIDEVKLPKYISYLGQKIFSGCTLEEVFIPRYLKNIDYTTMYFDSYGINSSYHYGYDCGPFTGAAVKKATFEEGMTVVPAGIFYMSDLEEAIIPDTVEELNVRCFSESKIKKIELPKKLKYIDGSAFRFCYYLEEIEFPDSLEFMGAYAFDSCTSLTSVDTPFCDNKGLFSNCTSLKKVTIGNGGDSIGAECFYKCSALESIVIPNGVKYIYQWAFRYCENLKSAVIPEGVQWIPERAFGNCSALKEIVLPESVTRIDERAFINCESLEKVTILGSVKYISDYTFYGCSSLTDIDLGSGVKEINESAFEGCSSLTKFAFPKTLTKIYKNAFANCLSMKEIYLQRGVESISDSAFSYPGDMTVYGLTGTYAETYAKRLSMKFVNREVKAQSITLAKDVVVYGKNSRQLSATLLPIDCTDEMAWTSSNEDVVEVDANGRLSSYGPGEATITVTAGDKSASCTVYVAKVSIDKKYINIDKGQQIALQVKIEPENVPKMKIKWESSNENVVTVDENGVITAIEEGRAEVYADIDEIDIYECFEIEVYEAKTINCTSVAELESYHYEDDVPTTWIYSAPGKTMIEVLFGSNEEVLCEEESIGIFNGDGSYSMWFKNGDIAGKSILIPGDTLIIKYTPDYYNWGFKVLEVSDCKHRTTEIRNIVNPGCETEGYTGDTYCTACGACVAYGQIIPANGHSWIAATTEYPMTCTVCGHTSGSKLYAVSGVVYSITNAGKKTVEYTNCTSKKTTDLVIPDTVKIGGKQYKVTSVSDNALAGNKKVKSVKIGKNITSIGANAFRNCTSLTKVTFSNSVKSIGASAFEGCKSIKSISIPVKCTSIGDKAFYKCSGLSKISIPDKVTSIGISAFEGCTRVESIKIGKSVKSIGSRAFYGNKKVLNITITSTKLTDVGKSAFAGESAKVSVMVPKKKLKSYTSLLKKSGINKKTQQILGK